MHHFIIGTAGHIDHGKTSLVKALTGIDTDRLKEEKERGITIDLGFAYWKDHITVIDVPGHERFIRNMVAGISAIDFVLLVVAADDGIMPQTREHLDILQLLQIRRGAVVITKIDAVPESRVAAIEEDVKIFLQSSVLGRARVFKVSYITKEGIGELRNYLEQTAQDVARRDDRSFFRMYVDRKFSVKGFGTVVTGTVLSGSAKLDDDLEWLPKREIVRVRGLQKHNHTSEVVAAGDRAAINLPTVKQNEITRGHVLAQPGHLALVRSFVAKAYTLRSSKKPLKKHDRIRLHIGTAELFGEIEVLGAASLEADQFGYVRICADEPLSCVYGDRFILREFNSASTVGGGMVLEHLDGEKSVPVAYLRDLESEDEFGRIACFIRHHKIVSLKNVLSVMGCSQNLAHKVLNALLKKDEIVIVGGPQTIADKKYLSELQSEIADALKSFHRDRPAERGVHKSVLRVDFKKLSDGIFETCIEQLVRNKIVTEDRGLLLIQNHTITLNPKDTQCIAEIEKRLTDHPFSPPTIEIVSGEMKLTMADLHRLTRIMTGLNKIIKTGDKIYFHSSAVDQARQILIDFIGKKGHITVIDFKQQLQTSRKFALSLLEFFDSQHLTIREGDIRILVR
jgi:selenocysteine-specific elongation factor